MPVKPTKEATAVLIDDAETMKIINQFANVDNRNPTNAARELIKRGINFTQAIPEKTNDRRSLPDEPQSITPQTESQEVA